jgi:hypothetical protein
VGTCCEGFYTRAQIAAADAKIKKKKQKEKQMAKEAETAAKAARVTAGAQATSHSESDAELGIVHSSERQITEITAAEQATSTQAAPDSTSIRHHYHLDGRPPMNMVLGGLPRTRPAMNTTIPRN